MKTAILLAAGSGSRMENSVEDKILTQICGRSVFSYSVSAFLKSGVIDSFAVVFRDAEQKKGLAAVLEAGDFQNYSALRNILWVVGGPERRDSVRLALQALPRQTHLVFIHDCARPLVDPGAIRDLNAALSRDRAATLAHQPADTIKRIAPAGALRQAELEDLQRPRLWAMETPQAFEFGSILNAYEQVERQNLHITDDVAAAAAVGIRTTLVPSSLPNPKITTPADLDYVEWLLQRSTLKNANS